MTFEQAISVAATILAVTRYRPPHLEALSIYPITPVLCSRGPVCATQKCKNHLK